MDNNQCLPTAIEGREQELRQRASVVAHDSGDSTTDDEFPSALNRQPIARRLHSPQPARNSPPSSYVAVQNIVQSFVGEEPSSPPLFQVDLNPGGGVDSNGGQMPASAANGVVSGLALEYLSADQSRAAVSLDPSTTLTTSVIAVDVSSDEEIIPSVTVTDGEASGDDVIVDDEDDNDVIDLSGDVNDVMIAAAVQENTGEPASVNIPGLAVNGGDVIPDAVIHATAEAGGVASNAGPGPVVDHDLVVVSSSQRQLPATGGLVTGNDVEIVAEVTVSSPHGNPAHESLDISIQNDTAPASRRAGTTSAASPDIDLSMVEFQSFKAKKRSRVEVEEADDDKLSEEVSMTVA